MQYVISIHKWLITAITYQTLTKIKAEKTRC
jgi:hypothetical protein